jgi:hypothetical protein
MNGGERVRGPWVFERDPALLRQAERAAKNCLRGGGAQTHQHLRFHELNLGLEPGTAGGDFGHARLFVQPALAALFKFEVLHGIRDIHMVPAHSGIDKSAVQYAAGRSDERMPLDIFVVPRLFADEEQSRFSRPFPEHGLRRVPVEVASMTLLYGGPERRKSRTRRNPRGSARRCGAWQVTPAIFRSGRET